MCSIWATLWSINDNFTHFDLKITSNFNVKDLYIDNLILTLVFGFGGGVGSEFCNIGKRSLATIPGFDSSS